MLAGRIAEVYLEWFKQDRLAQLKDKLTATQCTVAISNFVSFLENTNPYRQDLRRVEYGDERVPAQRAKLTLLGLDARVTEREQSGRTVYRVRVGPFDAREPAEDTQLRSAWSWVSFRCFIGQAKAQDLWYESRVAQTISKEDCTSGFPCILRVDLRLRWILIVIGISFRDESDDRYGLSHWRQSGFNSALQ